MSLAELENTLARAQVDVLLALTLFSFTKRLNT